jgi:uncharacterized protein (DUF362 family)/Pyruvate/2-oxoacid:ferredoxin oxidoreductase delta subunit
MSPPSHEKARVSVRRLESYEPEAVLREMTALLEPLGGMGAFVTKGAHAVLKPNFLRPASPDRAVTTHPEIIRAAARLAAEAGAGETVVTDSSGIGTARLCARRLGLGREGEAFSIQNADDGEDLDVEGNTFHRLKLSRRMRKADVLINLPKVKTHGQMVLTAAVKNLFGAVVGMEKVQWHLRTGRDPMEFARLVVHIFETISPALSIVDGVVGMEGNGPGAGRPRPLGLIIASAHAHALDAVLSEILGLPPMSVFTLRVAKSLGLLPARESIEVVGPPLEELAVRPKWQLARPVMPSVMLRSAWMSSALDRLATVSPQVQHVTCTRCEQCVASCAAEAITLAGKDDGHRGEIIIDQKRCISCFCCQEMCPEGAITVKAGLIARLLGLGIR